MLGKVLITLSQKLITENTAVANILSPNSEQLLPNLVIAWTAMLDGSQIYFLLV